jgi:hypothetical protein
MRHRAVAAQVTPSLTLPRSRPLAGEGGGAVLPVDAALGHALIQHFEPLLVLAAADDLADPRRRHVDRRDRPAVVVHPHVDGLMAFG